MSYIPNTLLAPHTMTCIVSHPSQKTALARPRANRTLSGELPGKSTAAQGQGCSHLSWGLQGGAALGWRSTRDNCDQGQNPHPRGRPIPRWARALIPPSVPRANGAAQLCAGPPWGSNLAHTLEPSPQDGKGWSLCVLQ